MSQTTYQKLEKPKDREQLLEMFLQERFEDLGAIFGNTYIDGLRLEWVSATSIKVKTGAADLPDNSRRLRVTSDITVSGISLGASAWGHVYLYNNAGVPAAEVVTTAPAGYFGTACQKGTDATRRYLGSVRTDGSGNVLNFYHHAGNRIRYRSDISPMLVLNGGTATAETNVSCSSYVPVTSRVAVIHAQNTSSNADVTFGAGAGASDDSVSPPTSFLGVVGSAGGAKDWVCDMPLNASQQFSYANTAAPNGAAYAYVYGYVFER